MSFLVKRPVQILILLLLLAGLVFLHISNPPVIKRIQNMTFDSYNRMYPRKAFDDVAIIDIDEASLQKYGQWPWPRTLVAQLPTKLKELGAKSVTFDIAFAEEDRTSPRVLAKTLQEAKDNPQLGSMLQNLPDNDEVFAKAIHDAGNVVTGFVGADKRIYHEITEKAEFEYFGLEKIAMKYVHPIPYFTTTLPILSSAAAGNGVFTMLPEDDGVVRKVPLLVGQQANYDDEVGDVYKIYPALSLEAVRVALGEKRYLVISNDKPSTKRDLGINRITIKKYNIPTDQNGFIYAYYAGQRKNIYIPAWKVIEGEIDKSVIDNKIVFVGTSSIGLLDLRSSPLNPSLPGVEVHAEIVEQILHKQFLLRPLSLEYAEHFFTVMVCAGIIALSPFIGTTLMAGCSLVLVSLGVVGSLFAYKNYGLLIEPVYPSLSVVMIFIVSSIFTHMRTSAARDTYKKAFNQYVSPRILKEIVKDPSSLRLGGEVREVSVMFTDIRNFTTISESMDPAELIRMMNDFLTPMTTCVMENDGFVDKYMGDAMMAFWNAPHDDAKHAKHACIAALGMVAALKPVNEMLQKRAEEQKRVFHELKAGVGINTGKCSVGNMGSKQRFAYSALGDTVNLASRLEGQTKYYGISIMISEETRKSAPGFAAIEIDLLTVKGRSEPERVYALLDSESEAKSDAFELFEKTHRSFLEAYRAQQWQDALDLIDACLALRADLLGLYQLYKGRIEAYQKAPPPEGWKGVWVAKEK